MKKVLISLLVIIICVFTGVFFYYNNKTEESESENSPTATSEPVATIEDNYLTQDQIFNSYKEFTYAITDIDNDNQEDIIIKDGSVEATSMYYIYRNVDSSYILVGSLSAGHTVLYKEPDSTYLTALYGQMGVEKITHNGFDTNKLTTKLVKDITLTEGQEYDTIKGALNFIEKN